LKTYKDWLTKIEENIDTPEEISKRYTGVAFVVFDEQRDMAQIVDNFKVSNIERVFAYIFIKIFKCWWRHSGLIFKGR